MEKSSDRLPSPEQELDGLESRLLSGQVSPDQFLDRVLALDQADPRRTSSLHASEILSRPEVVKKFQTPEQREQFYSVRALMYFHKAQIRLSEGEVNVKDDLERSIEDSLKLGPEQEDWIVYVKATIAYLDNDLETLKELAQAVEINKAFVRSFVRGLEERGHPDYRADYRPLAD